MYFENMPKINYDFLWNSLPEGTTQGVWSAGASGGSVPDVIMQDIFRRVSFTAKTINDNDSAFESYIVTEGRRPEDVAAEFYGDPHMWWLVLLSNNIIDPNVEWCDSQTEMQHTLNNFLSGDSYFVFEDLDARKGDVIIKRDSDGTIDSNNYGEIDDYNVLFHRIDVKKRVGTISQGDNVRIFRKNIINGQEEWNSISGIGETGCYQQYWNAPTCVDNEGTLCPSEAGADYVNIRRKETIISAVDHFEYESAETNPYSAYPTSDYGGDVYPGPSGDFFSYQNLCGMTGTILYKYITNALSSDIKIVTQEEQYIVDNDIKRNIRLISPSLVPNIISEYKSLMRGGVPRGTTTIIE
jgi:hypothetical protein